MKRVLHQSNVNVERVLLSSSLTNITMNILSTISKFSWIRTLVIIVLFFTYLGNGAVLSQTVRQNHQPHTLINTYGLDIIRLQTSKKDSIQTMNINSLIKKGVPQFIVKLNGEYSELCGLNALGLPVYLLSHNQHVSESFKATILNGENTNWDELGPFAGENMIIGVWENGRARPLHELLRIGNGNNYSSKIEYATTVPPQNNSITRHATHISGTLIGNQVEASLGTSSLFTKVQGIAYNGKIKMWDWLNSSTELAAAASEGLLVGNTSFGFNPTYLHPCEFGRYNDLSKEWDEVMCNAPYFQIFKSVGNARDDKEINGSPQYSQVTLKGGYDLLEGAGVSKNVIVVGAVNLYSDESILREAPYIESEIEEPYSSWGCTDDGRIKPDFVLHGNSVYSSSEQTNNSYISLTGTSMSAAGLTGGAVLLQEYWKKKFNIGYMRSATLKALLVHTADDILHQGTQAPIEGISDGPDYRNGWGVPNLYKAARTIKYRGETTIIKEEVLVENKPFILNLTANGSEPLVVTLAWTDPAGDAVPINIEDPNSSIDEQSSKLVNDLDVRLIKYDKTNEGQAIVSEVLLPWKLLDNGIFGKSIGELEESARRGVNNVDNIEKIEVPMLVNYDNPASIATNGGIYQLVITHKGNLTNSCSEIGQPFSLVISGVSMCYNKIVLLQHEDDIHEGEIMVNGKIIQASNIINENKELVEYNALDEIILLPQKRNGSNGSEGFTVVGGADFLAHINCQTTLSPEAFSSGDIENALNDTIIFPEYKPFNKGLIIYPNPLFNEILNVQFTNSERSDLRIEIYDVNGKLCRSKAYPELFEMGTHKVTVDLIGIPKGVYVIKSILKEKVYTSKLIIN